MLQHSSSMDRRGGVRSGMGLFRAAARRSRSVGDARPGRECQVTTSKLLDARADRAYDWGVVCAQCGNGAPSRESERSTGVRPGVGSSGLNARARAGVDRGVLGPCCRRVGGVSGVLCPLRVGGVRAFDGDGVRAWRPVLAGGAAPVLECWRSRNGVRGASIAFMAVAREAVPRRAAAAA